MTDDASRKAFEEWWENQAYPTTVSKVKTWDFGFAAGVAYARTAALADSAKVMEEAERALAEIVRETGNVSPEWARWKGNALAVAALAAIRALKSGKGE